MWRADAMAKRERIPSADLNDSSALRAAYDARVASGVIRADAAQLRVLERLQKLLDRVQGAHETSERGFFSPRAGKEAATQGMYLWGEVGRGKSMLMELFYAQVNIARKRRVHFHAFMQEVHARLHALRSTDAVRRDGADVIALLVHEISQHHQLLCFDELQATDVAEASLLFRLFEGLFAAGMWIVTTSNHPPASLYRGGIQHERFDKFIHLLEHALEVQALSSPQDYRLKQVLHLTQTYFYPLNQSAHMGLEAAVAALAAGLPRTHATLHIKGRDVAIDTYGQTIARASFAQLCGAALGPADYLEIAQQFDTLILTAIPQMSPDSRNEARRFVLLVDALYDHKVKLLCSADAAFNQLYTQGDGSFEFQRTASRLAEMQSEAYLNAPPRR